MGTEVGGRNEEGSDHIGREELGRFWVFFFFDWHGEVNQQGMSGVEVFDFIWTWTRGQEQLGGEGKEREMGCGVSLIFGMQSPKKQRKPQKTRKKTKKTNGATKH